jgi:hypothetical protein
VKKSKDFFKLIAKPNQVLKLFGQNALKKKTSLVPRANSSIKNFAQSIDFEDAKYYFICLKGERWVYKLIFMVVPFVT